MKRAALLLTMSAFLSLGLAAPVFAAVPGNDTYTNRTMVSSLPFSETIDTADATTDADDIDAAGPCGGFPTDASVWYEVTATSPGGLLVDVGGSSYSAGVFVVTGAPGSFTFLGCGAPSIPFGTVVGETYTIVVFDYQADGGGNGGTLSISIGEIPPPPVIDVSVNASGSFNPKTGLATVRGTITCTGGQEFDKNFMDVQLTQAIGRIKINGDGISGFSCDGTTQAWSVVVFSSTGKFGGGKAQVTMYVSACGIGGCSEQFVNQTITLKK